MRPETICFLIRICNRFGLLVKACNVANKKAVNEDLPCRFRRGSHGASA